MTKKVNKDYIQCHVLSLRKNSHSSQFTVKGTGSFLVIMTNIEEVQLFELILNLGKNGGQICKANFLCSLTFTK